MRTPALVSVEEYLSTDYSPDCDYVDGKVLERNMGEYDHARLQAALTAHLFNRRKELGIHVVTEQRVQVRLNRFRVPDICVVAGPEPDEQILTRPPFLCIEILSPEDRMERMQERIADYFAFGVRYAWLINPRTRQAWICTPGFMREAADGILRTEDPKICVPLAGLFS
jgi:Uma2 family endonuclease